MMTRVEGQAETALRTRLVEQLVNGGWIRSQPVMDAFESVPRHVFLPGVDPVVAYTDEAVVTRTTEDGRPLSSSSQPAIMAAMLEQLTVEPGQRVLEIGAGTGYNAALLARLAGDPGAVTTIDIDRELVEQARHHLVNAGFAGVTVACADGAGGWPDNAPYDRIIVTAGAPDLPAAWTEQLTKGGRLVLPLSLRGMQQSVAFDNADGHLVSVSIVNCGFMPIRGTLAGPDSLRTLGERPGIFLKLVVDHPVDTVALYSALTQPGEVVPIGVTLTPEEAHGGLGLWLALREDDLGQLAAVGPAVDYGLVPPLLTMPGMTAATVLVGRGGLAALVPHDSADGAEPGGVAIRTFGADVHGLAERLAARIREWDERGRPSTSDLRIQAHRQGSGGGDAAATIDMPHTRFSLDWDHREPS
jgi:protein-L-isoaspartate(D-aspartate) O-methyltransferase